MIIFITEPALNDPAEKYLFREKTIISLKKIVDNGLRILLKADQLSTQQINVLEQEQISFLKEGEGDFSIVVNVGRLEVKKEDELVESSENWDGIVRFFCTKARTATITRKTNETDIQITVNLDGTGVSQINTGLKFFDHMLEQISRHGLINLDIKCDGDLEVDEHHTIEDVSIALGDAIYQALGSKKGIERYGFVLPMDEAQATVALDLSGRPYLVFEGEFKREYVGDVPTEMVKHFFYSLTMNLKSTLHISFKGENDHHKIEACFKGFARALKMAVERNSRIEHQIPSSKGAL